MKVWGNIHPKRREGPPYSRTILHQGQPKADQMLPHLDAWPKYRGNLLEKISLVYYLYMFTLKVRKIQTCNMKAREFKRASNDS